MMPMTETEIERRIAEARERRGKTYLGQASGDLDDLGGGRFGVLRKATIIGGDRVAKYPQQPSRSPWANEPSGTEPSLGYSVEQMEPVGEAHERRHAASDVSAHVVDAGSGIRLRRRI